MSHVLPPELRRVLLLMTDHHLGNLVVSLPVIERLAAHFAHPPDLLVDERYASLAELLPSVGRVWRFPSQQAKRRSLRANLGPLGVLGRLAGRYRTVIDVGGGIRSATLGALLLAGRRLGRADTRRSWLYTRRVDPGEVAHALDRYSALLGFVRHDGRPARLRLRAQAEATAKLAQKLAEQGVSDDRPLVVFHVGAGDWHRIYPPQRFAETARLLVREKGARIVAIGAPGEAELVDRFLEATGGDAFWLRCGLEELLALFERAAVIISNEGGPTHLAAATETPIVTIFGPSREQNWSPVRETDVVLVRGRECLEGCRRSRCVADLPCLGRISASALADAARPFLRGERGLPARREVAGSGSQLWRI